MTGEETNIIQRIRLRASQLGKVLFRNNNGAFQDATGRWVKYGLGDGTSDLIGWTPIIITSEMVGKTLAVFTAYEAKTEKGMKPSGKKQKEHFKKQKDFLDFVVKNGGIAKFLTSEKDL